MLSGFVIAHVIDSKPVTVREFVVGRLTRITPLYWLLTILVFCIAALKPDLLNSTSASIPNLLKSLAFIPYRKENGLLQPMLFVGWSLNYEMFFYAVSTLALLFMSRLKFAGIVGALMVAFIAANISNSGYPIVDFLAQQCVLEFGLGIGAWFMWKRGWQFPPFVAAACAVSLYASMAATEWMHIKGVPLLCDGVPSCFLLMCALSLESMFASRNYMTRLLLFLGDASYATYLSHPYVVEAARKLMPRFLHGFVATSPPGIVFVILCATLAGSAIYWFVDRPLHLATGRLTLANGFAARSTGRP